MARATRPNKTQRLLDLLAFLSARRLPVRFDAIVEGVPGYGVGGADGDGPDAESTRRQFERDKAELRDLGIPLETVPAHPGALDPEPSYRLSARDFYLPVLRLLQGDEEGKATDPAHRGGSGGRRRAAPVPELAVRPEELRAAVESLRHVQDLPAFPLRLEARSALAKLTFDLASEAAMGLPEALDEAPRVLHLSSFDPVRVEASLHGASEALRRRKTLRFDYYAIGPDRREPREVHPAGLLYQGSYWYLVAHDLGRGEDRVFRIDRMENVEVEKRRPRTPDYELPEDHSLAAFRRRAPWELADTEEHEVRVRFIPPLDLLAVRNEWGEADGDGVRRFRVRTVEPFLRWLLTHCGRAEVLEPGELRDRLEELRRRVLEVHAAGPEQRGGGQGGDRRRREAAR